jgi:hypothetical protein
MYEDGSNASRQTDAATAAAAADTAVPGDRITP